MKNKLPLIIYGLFFTVFFLSSCSLGFLPSWKEKEKAVISLQFSTLDSTVSDTDNTRAIIQGDGFLYIRTLGGPKGEKGPLYGPYAIKAGSVFETDDIPAGKYSKGIAVLYSAIELGGLEATMKLPDDQFKAGLDGAVFVDTLSGVASTAITDSKTIKAGQKNSLSLTLIPIVNAANTVDLSLVQKYTVTPATIGGSVKKFIKLNNITSGVPLGDSIKDVVCNVSGPGTVSRIAMYDSLGSLMPTTISTTESGKFTASYTSGTTFYLYIESSGGAVDLDFSLMYTSGATSKGNILVSISGAAAEAGKTVYFTILPTSNSTTFLAAGKFVITNDGSGSGIAQNLITGLPITLTPGTYFVWAYIDVNGSAATGFDGLDAGEPSFISTGTAVTAVQTALPLTRTSFTAYSPYEGYVYYVSNLGGGNGTLPSSPLTFDDAFAAIYGNESDIDGLMNWIVLTENITTSDEEGYGYSLYENKDVTITSAGGTPYTITLGTNISEGPFLNVVENTTLTLMAVTISGDNSDPSFYAASGLVMVGAGGIFNMMPGSKLTNNQISGSGAGVFVYGGTFIMTGGEISNCISGEGGGGGVYVTSASEPEVSASFSMFGGTITNCSTSYGNGGGVYINSGSMTFGGNATITGNTALYEGGGLYLGSGLTAFSLVSTSISITGNKIESSYDIGSGVYIIDNGTPGQDAYDALNVPALVHDNFYDSVIDSDGNDVSLYVWQ